jgi:hypothetical protein
VCTVYGPVVLKTAITSPTSYGLGVISLPPRIETIAAVAAATATTATVMYARVRRGTQALRASERHVDAE